MATSAHTGTSGNQQGAPARCKSSRQRQPMRILFVHSDVTAVERCLHELNSVRFTVNSDVARNAEELVKRVASQRYDLIVAECPGTDRQGMQTTEFLRQTNQRTPLIFVTDTLRRETATEFARDGVHDCIEMDRIARFPRRCDGFSMRRICGKNEIKPKKSCDIPRR